jgi:hypothetical protein
MPKKPVSAMNASILNGNRLLQPQHSGNPMKPDPDLLRRIMLDVANSVELQLRAVEPHRSRR